MGAWNPGCVIRCWHEADQRLYTRPSPLFQAPYGHLIGSPKMCINITNMEEDKSILSRMASVGKPPRQNTKSECRNPKKIGNPKGKIQNACFEI